MSIAFRAAVVVLTAMAVGLAAQSEAPSAADRLYTAIRSGDAAQVDALVKAGADVNSKERRGEATPLMYAAAFGSLDTTRLLLDRGADVKARNTNGATALMWAATDLAKIRLLVDRGAEVNAMANSGRSVLLIAAITDPSAKIVRIMLAQVDG